METTLTTGSTESPIDLAPGELQRWTRMNMKIEKGHIHWFIHETDHTPLGFIRLSKGGALVIGGKTGTHLTGHGETYWKKLKDIIALGYVPVEVAVELKLLQPHWSPPEISSPTEREWIEKIKGNEM